MDVEKINVELLYIFFYSSSIQYENLICLGRPIGLA